MTKRVLILNGDSYHAAFEMFKRHGWKPTRDPNEANLICFLGGTDVDPKIYGEERGPHTQAPDVDRDKLEVQYYKSAQARGTPCVGICRGGQLLNVLNGGKMIQHLGETISGDVYMEDEHSDYYVRVDHHQGIVAHKSAKSIGIYDLCNGGGYLDYACWYPETKSLCFQPHPEWDHKPTEDLFFELIKEYIE